MCSWVIYILIRKTFWKLSAGTWVKLTSIKFSIIFSFLNLLIYHYVNNAYSLLNYHTILNDPQFNSTIKITQKKFHYLLLDTKSPMANYSICATPRPTLTWEKIALESKSSVSDEMTINHRHWMTTTNADTTTFKES